MPGTAWLAVALGVAAFALDLFAARRALRLERIGRAFALNIAFPVAVLALTYLLAGPKTPIAVNIALALLIVAAIGLFLYRLAFQPLAHTSVLVLLDRIGRLPSRAAGAWARLLRRRRHARAGAVERGLHRRPAALHRPEHRGLRRHHRLHVALWLFFGTTLMGKALRATAVNRLGARLVGIRTTLSGQIAFLLAAVIGAISGILIVPITTLYYDTGFLIGLKGFIAAIIGGLVSYPLTAVAAIIVGTVEAFSSFYASNFKEVIVFTLIIPVLVLRSLAAPAVEEEGD